MKSVSFFLLVCMTFSFYQQALAEDQVAFEITVEGNFTKGQHPKRFPSNPHFSPVVITSHDANYSIFPVGTKATAGVKDVAETGNRTQLVSEIAAKLELGHVLEQTNTTGFDGDETVKAMITVSREYPLLSVISMIAPSPDWVIGVNGLSLLEDGEFIEERTIALYAFDAGTDKGKYFESRNRPNRNPETIHLLTNVAGAPIKNVFATLKIKRVK